MTEVNKYTLLVLTFFLTKKIREIENGETRKPYKTGIKIQSHDRNISVPLR